MKNNMMLPMAVAVCLAVLLVSQVATAADPIILSPFKTGVIDWQTNNNSIRGHGGLAVGEYPGNHSAGYAPSLKSGYALWDLSAVTERIASGNFRSTLSVGAPTGWYDPFANDSAQETVTIRDVGTDLQILNDLRTDGFFLLFSDTAPLTPRQVADDLMSGLPYGSAVATPSDVGQPFSIPIDWRGIQDINTAAGTAMGMGFQPSSGPRELLNFNSPQLVLYPFNSPVGGGAGLDFELDDGDITGGGEVSLTERGVRHRMSVHAIGMQTTDEKFSEVRQRFTFEAQGGGVDPRAVLLTGDLDGTLLAADGIARVEAALELYQIDGTLLDEIKYVEGLEAGLSESLSSGVAERLELQAELVPGEIYEVISRLDLFAQRGGFGSAEALFSESFDVEVSGVPEPTTLLLFVLGAVGCLARRRSRLG